MSSDAFTKHCTAMELMQQGKYTDARPLLVELEAVAKKPAATADSYVPQAKQIAFAMAYCDYRASDFIKVRDALKPIADGDAACLNLLAQAHYNLEEFTSAAAIYEAMLRDGLYRDDVERTELVTNLTAAYSQFSHTSCLNSAAEQGFATFDLAFNAATGMIHAKEYAQARELLGKALALCLHEHEFDASSTDILELARQASEPGCDAKIVRLVSDAAPVLVQRAFVHFAINEQETACEILKVVLALKEKLSVATYAAACVNWVAIKRDTEYFDTLTRLKEVQKPAVEAKLTRRQKLFIKYNTALLHLSTAVGQPQRGADQCKRIVDQMIKEFPSADLTAMALTAWLARHGVSSKSEDHFRAFVANRAVSAENDTTTRLTTAQFALLRGDLRSAADRLAADTPLLVSCPAAIATVAHIYGALLNDRDAAVAVLTGLYPAFDALHDAAKRTDFYAFCADFLLEHRRHSDATRALSALLTVYKKDDAQRVGWVAKLVQAAARSYDASSATKWAAQLPSAVMSTATASAVPQPMPRQGIEEMGFRRPVNVVVARELRPARNRALRRVPKAPEGQTLPPLDPERWVPIKARTYMRDVAPRRQKELKRRRAAEQDEKRRQAERRKREAAAAAVAATPAPASP